MNQKTIKIVATVMAIVMILSFVVSLYFMLSSGN